MRAPLAGLAAVMLTAAAPIVYPVTPKGPVVDVQHGVSVADPYRWLENDVRNDKQVEAWVAEENKVTNAYLATLPKRDAIKTRLTELWNYERFGVPRLRGTSQFYTRNAGLQNQAVLYVQQGDSPARVLIDPNPWATDGATALAEWTPSKDGKFLAYAVQDGGTDWRTVRVRDVATGTDLADTLEGVKYTGEVAWLSDGSGFYYSRFPAPPAGQKYQSETLNEAIWFHRIGTPQSADTMVFATPDRPRLGHHAELSDDGRWMVVSSFEGSGGNAIFIADRSKGETPRPLVTGLDKEWLFAGSEGGDLWFVTNSEAPRYHLLGVDGATGKRSVVVPEGKATMTGGALVGKRLVVDTLEDAKSVVRLYETDGKPAGTVPLPGIGTAAGFEAATARNLFCLHQLQPADDHLSLSTAPPDRRRCGRTPKVAFNPDDYRRRAALLSRRRTARGCRCSSSKKGPRPKSRRRRCSMAMAASTSR